MKFCYIWPVTAVSLLILASCGGGGVSTNPGANSPANAPATNASLPRSLKQGNNSESESAPENNTEDNDSHSVVTSSANEVGALVTSNDDVYHKGLPLLLSDMGLLQDQMDMTTYRLAGIDAVWDQLEAYCESIADGATCDIPAGTLKAPEQDKSDDDAQEENDPLCEMDGAGSVCTNEGNGEGHGSNSIWANQRAEYVRNPSTDYAHQLTLFSDYAEGSDSEEMSWNQERSRIAMKAKGSWTEDGLQSTFSADQLYNSADAGVKITGKDEYSSNGETYSSSHQLHASNDDKNSVEALTTSSWSNDIHKGTYTSKVIANDDGGQSDSVMKEEFDGTTYSFHTRDKFDGKGQLISSQYCDSSDGKDCADAANWTDVDLNGNPDEDELNTEPNPLPDFSPDVDDPSLGENDGDETENKEEGASENTLGADYAKLLECIDNKLAAESDVVNLDLERLEEQCIEELGLND